jgi:hypothetical protein
MLITPLLQLQSKGSSMSKKLHSLCDVKLYIVETSPLISIAREHFTMPTRPARLLCVGEEPELMQTRCVVLSQSGHNARSATLEEAEILLKTSKFDLVIVSAWLSEWERGRILVAAGKTPVLVLTGLTLAEGLLAQVKRLLPSTTSGPF